MNPVWKDSKTVVLEIEDATLTVTFNPALASEELDENYFIFADLPCAEICPECRL